MPSPVSRQPQCRCQAENPPIVSVQIPQASYKVLSTFSARPRCAVTGDEEVGSGEVDYDFSHIRVPGDVTLQATNRMVGARLCVRRERSLRKAFRFGGNLRQTLLCLRC